MQRPKLPDVHLYLTRFSRFLQISYFSFRVTVQMMIPQMPSSGSPNCPFVQLLPLLNPAPPFERKTTVQKKFTCNLPTLGFWYAIINTLANGWWGNGFVVMAPTFNFCENQNKWLLTNLLKDIEAQSLPLHNYVLNLTA